MPFMVMVATLECKPVKLGPRAFSSFYLQVNCNIMDYNKLFLIKLLSEVDSC